MPLSQALFDRVAAIATTLNGDMMEDLVYLAREDATDAGVAYPVQGKFEEYSAHIVGLHSLVADGQVRGEDRRLRLATSVVTWEPTTYDLVTRADGTVWRVLTLEGGTRRVYWFMQTRQVAS